MHNRTKKITLLIVSGLLVASLAGAWALNYTSQARAQEPVNREMSFDISLEHGGPGFPGEPGASQEALANALGISVETLQAAQQKASDAAIQQALDQGLITQAQADAMILGGGGFRFGLELKRRGGSEQDVSIDSDALLADALGISVDELAAARQQAQADLLAQAVADGKLTQGQADLILARQALQKYLDPEALFAEALGISADQLQSYRDEGLTLSQILEKAGMTATEVRDAQRAAYQAAVQKAVNDGVISQEQADEILAGGFRGFGGMGGFGRLHEFGGWLGGFGEQFGGFNKPFGGRPGNFGAPPGAPETNPNSTTPPTTPGSDI